MKIFGKTKKKIDFSNFLKNPNLDHANEKFIGNYRWSRRKDNCFFPFQTKMYNYSNDDNNGNEEDKKSKKYKKCCRKDWVIHKV